MTEFINLYNVRKIGEKDWDEIDMQLLNIEVEKTKCNLSNSTTDCIMYPNLFKPLKRSKFEELNADLFESTIKIVKDVLIDAEMDKNKVDRIILVGGSTKIPKIKQLLSKRFFCWQRNNVRHKRRSLSWRSQTRCHINWRCRFQSSFAIRS